MIPTYLRAPGDLEVTIRMLETLRATAPGVEALFVDDASPADVLVDEMEAAILRLDSRLIRKPENTGFSSTVNVGLREALDSGRDAILVNADIEFCDEGWADRMAAQPRQDGEGPAAIVGALLLYPNGLIQHAGIFFCSPGDEPVLTARDGYVRLADLDPDRHGLVSYSRQEGRIFRAATRAGRWAPGNEPRHGGYAFEKGSRHYAGEMLEIQTRNGHARVTPNHKLTAFWTREGLASYAVYVMRRGRDWRVGHTKVQHGNAFGPRLRLDANRGDAVWILDAFPTKHDAIAYESLMAWTYGVPTMQFVLSGAAGISQEAQDEIWRQLDVEADALELLAHHGRRPDLPLLVGRGTRLVGDRRRPIGVGRRWPLSAANLMPGLMEVPTDPGQGQQVERLPFAIRSDPAWSGTVYSLDVVPHHHYVSGGVIVQNSFLHRTFGHRYQYAPGDLPEAQAACVCPVTGALQYIRHSCLVEIGLYDEAFKLGFEDVDYCFRALTAGHDVVYQPTVRALHYESLFRGQGSEKINAWQEESWQTFMLKWKDQSFAQWVPPM